METKYTDVMGVRMRHEEAGEGRPVVLLHGIPTSPALWRRVVPLLEGVHAFAWEMVGYGASIPQGEGRDISVAKQADYLASWLDAVGLERAVVVAHDLGGGVAQNLAVKHPERVEGLVFTNAICYDSWPVAPVKVVRALGGAFEHMPGGMFRQTFRLFMHQGHDDPAQEEAALNAHWPHYEQHGGAAAFVRQVRSLDVRDTLAIADRIPELDVPARVVWGAAAVQSIGYGYRLAYELRCSLDRIEGGKHFTPEDHPDRVANAVNSLLEELEAL